MNNCNFIISLFSVRTKENHLKCQKSKRYVRHRKMLWNIPVLSTTHVIVEMAYPTKKMVVSIVSQLWKRNKVSSIFEGRMFNIYMEKVRENTLSSVVIHSYITFYSYGLMISLFHIKVITTRSNKPPLLQFRLFSYYIALFSHRHNKITNITSYNDFNVQLVIFFRYIFSR